MKRIQQAILAFFVAAASHAFAGPEGIAFITDMKGEVSVDGNARPALLSELTRGQKIVVGRQSQASVMYIATGKEYVLRGPADYTVKDHEISGSSAMPPTARETAWRTNNKVLAQVAQTSAASVRMRSMAQARAPDKLAFPTQGAVATLQPTLRWRGEAAAPSEVMVMIPGQEKPVHTGKAKGLSYRIPAKVLAADTDYVWVVSVSGSEIGSARFRTLPADALEQVEQRRPSERADFSDRLMFALMLREMGAVQEAQEAWTRLAQERTDLPELAGFAK